MEKVEFEIELPNGKGIKNYKSTELTEEQYLVAVQLQNLQTNVQQLANVVNEYNQKQDHFRLKQKELVELLGINGADSGSRRKTKEP